MSFLPDARPTWAEIDVAAFDRNVALIRSRLPEGARLVAVLKANGYGHGAVELARRLTAEQVAMIAIATLDEGLELRRAGITLPILLFGPTNAIDVALEHDITLGVVGPEELAQLRDREATIHLKLDSGMGRMGVTHDELREVIAMLRSANRLRVGGIYTHMANADDPADPFTEEQIAKYDQMLELLREAGIDAPLHHFANSAATLRGLVRPGELARVGIALYGPGEPWCPTEPVMKWRTEIVRLKTLPAGHAIGYGTTFHTKRPSRIATLPVGYADGYSRRLSNRGEVVIRGKRAPVVGRVSMDLITVDVTDADAALGDEVILLGAELTAAEIASKIDTISYEVFCNVSARVPRVYRTA